MIEPAPVSGLHPQATWSSQMLAYFRSFRLLPGPGYRIKQSTNGIILDIPVHGGGQGKGVTIQEFIFQSHGQGADTDYILCNPSSGGAQVKILKPLLLRFSVVNRNGITYSAWDPVGQTRLATNPLASVTQVITPQYVIGDLILAISGTWTVVSSQPKFKGLIDLNVDARAFAGP